MVVNQNYIFKGESEVEKEDVNSSFKSETSYFDEMCGVPKHVEIPKKKVLRKKVCLFIGNYLIITSLVKINYFKRKKSPPVTRLQARSTSGKRSELQPLRKRTRSTTAINSDVCFSFISFDTLFIKLL